MLYLDNCSRENNYELVLNKIQKQLDLNGIPYSVITTTKNGMDRVGIRVGKTGDVVCPILYPSMDEAPGLFAERAKEALKNKPVIDIDILSDWQFVKDHIELDIQRRSNEPLLKRECLNLDLILRIWFDIPGHGRASTKVTSKIMDLLHVSEEILWANAEHNSMEKYRIRSMSEMIGFGSEDKEPSSMYVLTKIPEMTGGASALACTKVFRDWCLTHDEKRILLLPSSVEELILLPGSVSGDPQDLANMVANINDEVVKDSTIILDPVVYMYDLETDSISIVAEA